jgi:Zn-dependent peptidase ImmA (M78 family)
MGRGLDRGFKTRCETQAAHLREQLNLAGHEPLPAEKLADNLGIEIFCPQDIPDLSPKMVAHLLSKAARNWSAVTFIAEAQPYIIENTTHSPARRQSDLMHETSHIVLKHKPIRIVSVSWFPFPLREYRKVDEAEAEWLGGCLQVPRIGLEWAIKCQMEQDQIAEYYGASIQMVNYRRNVTGINRQFT